MILSNKDFLGHEYYAFAKQNYDNARNYLKNCGKPKDNFDRWFIEQAKLDVQLFGRWVK